MNLSKKTKSYLSLIYKKYFKKNYILENMYDIMKYNIVINNTLNDFIIDNLKLIDNLYSHINKIKKYKIKKLNNNYTYDYYPYKQYKNDNKINISFNDFIYKYHSDLEFQNKINNDYINNHDKIIDNYNMSNELKDILKLINNKFFISLDIKLYSQTYINKLLMITTDIFKLNIYYDNKLYNNKQIKNIYINIFVIINWIFQLSIKKNLKLNIYIILSPIKKDINNYEKFIIY